MTHLKTYYHKDYAKLLKRRDELKIQVEEVDNSYAELTTSSERRTMTVNVINPIKDALKEVCAYIENFEGGEKYKEADLKKYVLDSLAEKRSEAVLKFEDHRDRMTTARQYLFNMRHDAPSMIQMAWGIVDMAEVKKHIADAKTLVDLLKAYDDWVEHQKALIISKASKRNVRFVETQERIARATKYGRLFLETSVHMAKHLLVRGQVLEDWEENHDTYVSEDILADFVEDK